MKKYKEYLAYFNNNKYSLSIVIGISMAIVGFIVKAGPVWFGLCAAMIIVTIVFGTISYNRNKKYFD